MIPVFRKIRKKMADDNRPYQYMRYAVGEIALVVIGILIALQINNWNEARKDRKMETQALFNLKSEFDENQKRLQFLVDIKRNRENYARTYLEQITSDSIPLSHKTALEIPSGFAKEWGATNAVLNSLLNTGGIDKIQNDTLKFLLTNWPVLVDNYKSTEIRYETVVGNKIDYLNQRTHLSLVKAGDYSHRWPGNYFPNNIETSQDSLKATFINDILFFNVIGNLISESYIQSMHANNLDKNYKKISKLIDQELQKRNFNPE